MSSNSHGLARVVQVMIPDDASQAVGVIAPSD